MAECRSPLRDALTNFAQAARASYQSRLFAEDALQVLRIVYICNETFDVLVMNPPFGEPSRSTKAYLEETLQRSKGNILAHFIERSIQLVRARGRIGAIVSRTCFYLQSFSSFRKTVLSDELSLESFVDLGEGVLDAMVETAAVTWDRNSTNNNSAIFFRELSRAQKNKGVLASIHQIKQGVNGPDYFERNIEQFKIFDDSPYVYWIDAPAAQKIAEHPPIDPAACSIRVGLQTGDDFRFLRLWWEIDGRQIVQSPSLSVSAETQEWCVRASFNGKVWAWYSKTESASPILSSIHIVVKWQNNGSEIKAYHIGNGHTASKYVMSESLYFLPGISYMLRSSCLVPYIVPSGVIPTAGRSQVYPKGGQETWLAALLSSNLATAIARFRGEAFWRSKFQNSMVSVIPYIQPNPEDVDQARAVISSIRERMAERYENDETEIIFVMPTRNTEYNWIETFDRRSIVGVALDERIAELCGLTASEFQMLQRDHDEALIRSMVIGEDNEGEKEEAEERSLSDVAIDGPNNTCSWAFGVAFGRFDWRLATGERSAEPEPDPFDPLPSKSPGMLPDGANPFHLHSGILVDDHSHTHDVGHLVEEVLTRVNSPVPSDLRHWLQREFFPLHLQRYSKSRRKAPIYWPLATYSGSYTLWLYYPDLNSQTLYTAINEFVEPKLESVGHEQASLRNKGNERNRDNDKALEALQTLEKELVELRETLLRIAPTYRPNHDDGVQITAAPLWPLFRHKPWQKLLKETWAKLERGDYDWSHLAMTHWPGRVREKCKTDKSLAIAHGLEELYEPPPESALGAGHGGRKRRVAVP